MIQQPPVQPAAAGSPPGALDQSTLQKIVMAGQRLMYDPKTTGYFINDLKKQGDPTDILTATITVLIKLLEDKAKGNLPKQVIAPAAIALMVEAAHFAAQAGFFVMNKQALAVTAKKIITTLMQQYGGPDTGAQPAAQPAAAPAPASAPAPGGIIGQAQAGGAP